jgi:Undecaprenyl-phosphate glucose phosphotransferase
MYIESKPGSTQVAVVTDDSDTFVQSKSAAMLNAKIRHESYSPAGDSIQCFPGSASRKISLTDPSVMIVFMLVDAALIFFGSVAAWFAYHQTVSPDLPNLLLYIKSGSSFAIIFVANGLRGSSYGFLWGIERSEASVKIFRGFVQAFLFFVTLLVFTHWSIYYSRITLVLQFAFCGALLLLLRSVQFNFLNSSWARKFLVTNRVVLVGLSKEIDMALTVWRRKEENILVLKKFALSEIQEKSERPQDVLSEFVENLVEECRALKPDRIVILLPVEKRRAINFLVQRFAELPVSVLVSTESLATAEFRTSTHVIGGLGMLRIVRKPLSVTDRILKRTLDFSIATLLAVLLLPVFAIVMLAIKLDSPGPVLFVQLRRGFNQDQFRMFKFRTMSVASAGETFKQTSRNDRRITRVGRWLRRLNIDELPQLLNVIRGEMSLVGPRPHAVEHDDMYYSEIAVYARRHNMKPGITGLAQAKGFRGATHSLQQMQDRIDQDLAYIQNWSLLLDFKILLMTVFSTRAYKNAY